MNRREAISRVALLMGSTIIGAELFISGCKSDTAAALKFELTAEQIKLLNEIGGTILPATAASGGAKEAMVGQFMQVMVRDCYTKDDQKIFTDGLTALDKRCDKTYGKSFQECSEKERHELLVKLDAEVKEDKKSTDLLKQKEIQKEKGSQASGKPNYLKKTFPVPYFAMIKQLTLLGYFTSEAGYKSMGYVIVPGRYDGDVKHA